MECILTDDFACRNACCITRKSKNSTIIRKMYEKTYNFQTEKLKFFVSWLGEKTEILKITYVWYIHDVSSFGVILDCRRRAQGGESSGDCMSTVDVQNVFFG